MDSQNEAVNRFLATHGKAAARVVGVLAKKEKFKRALETETGQELMSDALNRMEQILSLIVEEQASPQELAEFRALRDILTRWQDKLADYTKAIQQIANNKIGV